MKFLQELIPVLRQNVSLLYITWAGVFFIGSYIFYGNLYFPDSRYYFCGSHGLNLTQLSIDAREFCQARGPAEYYHPNPRAMIFDSISQKIHYLLSSLQELDYVKVRVYLDSIGYHIFLRPFSRLELNAPHLYCGTVLFFIFILRDVTRDLKFLILAANPYVLMLLTNFTQDALIIAGSLILGQMIAHLKTREKNRPFIIVVIFCLSFIFLLRPEMLVFLLVIGSIILITRNSAFLIFLFFLALTFFSEQIAWISPGNGGFIDAGREFYKEFGRIYDGGYSWILLKFFDYTVLTTFAFGDRSAFNTLIGLSFSLYYFAILFAVCKWRVDVALAVIFFDFLIFLLSPSVGAFYRYRLPLFFFIIGFQVRYGWSSRSIPWWLRLRKPI